MLILLQSQKAQEEPVEALRKAAKIISEGSHLVDVGVFQANFLDGFVPSPVGDTDKEDDSDSETLILGESSD